MKAKSINTQGQLLTLSTQLLEPVMSKRARVRLLPQKGLGHKKSGTDESKDMGTKGEVLKREKENNDKKIGIDNKGSLADCTLISKRCDGFLRLFFKLSV